MRIAEAPALEVRNLTKIYSKSIVALDKVSFTVAKGEIFGLLGPNGAGKSTLVKAALTLTRQTEGEVLVMGVDTRKERSRARRLMGYVPQEVSVDGDLSGFENLLMFSKLYGVSGEDRKSRIGHALNRMGLGQRAKDVVKTYSGGMMRRLEIAQAIVTRPKMLFLDEPSIGLDPGARHEVWRLIKELKDELDTTILITTHDMAEAERLCDRVAIINQGKLVVTGTPAELRSLVGGDIVTIKLKEGMDMKASQGIRFPAEIGAAVLGEPWDESNPSREVSVVVKTSAEAAALKVARAFENSGFEIDSISYSRPSLDDVFLKFTSTRIGDVETFTQARAKRRSVIGHGN